MTEFHLVRRDLDRKTHDAGAARSKLGARVLPRAVTDFAASAPYFQLDARLETAINMALAVGAPLLLTGEPGTGKTQVAYFLGWYFGIDVFSYQVRSTSTSEDLEYDFDAVGYLRAAQHPSPEEQQRERHEFLTEKALWQAYRCKGDTVLLIDEIDKVPRDFPNDLLQELDKHPFKDEYVEPASGRPPVVVITSNAERLRPYGLACIAPGALPAFLGEGQVRSAPAPNVDPGLIGELRAWAAATALSADPVDPATAYALRRALELEVSPLGFEQLIRNGEDRAGRLAWPATRRVELLEWLGRAEALDRSGQVPTDSLLGRALGFWRERNAEERSRRKKAESRLHPWKGTAAEQLLNLEQALLNLWTDPADAAKALYGLFRGAFREEVRRRLAAFAPRDWASVRGRVRLPWRWASQPEKTRWLYGKMGLGGKDALATPADLRPSATLGAALGLCLGLFAVAALVALRPPCSSAGPIPRAVSPSPASPKELFSWVPPRSKRMPMIASASSTRSGSTPSGWPEPRPPTPSTGA